MQVKKEEKKKSIVNAAIKLLAERGIEKVSTNDIAREARVGKGTIYVYFRSKEDLLREVANEVYGSFTKDLRESLRASSSLDRFIDMLVNRILENVQIRGRLLYMLHRYFKGENEAYQTFQKEYRKALEKVFSKYNDELDIEFDELHFFITSFLMSSYILSRDIEIERIKEIVKRGLKSLLMRTHK